MNLILPNPLKYSIHSEYSYAKVGLEDFLSALGKSIYNYHLHENPSDQITKIVLIIPKTFFYDYKSALENFVFTSAYENDNTISKNVQSLINNTRIFTIEESVSRDIIDKINYFRGKKIFLHNLISIEIIDFFNSLNEVEIWEFWGELQQRKISDPQKYLKLIKTFSKSDTMPLRNKARELFPKDKLDKLDYFDSKLKSLDNSFDSNQGIQSEEFLFDIFPQSPKDWKMFSEEYTTKTHPIIETFIHNAVKGVVDIFRKGEIIFENVIIPAINTGMLKIFRSMSESSFAEFKELMVKSFNTKIPDDFELVITKYNISEANASIIREGVKYNDEILNMTEEYLIEFYQNICKIYDGFNAKKVYEILGFEIREIFDKVLNKGKVKLLALSTVEVDFADFIIKDALGDNYEKMSASDFSNLPELYKTCYIITEIDKLSQVEKKKIFDQLLNLRDSFRCAIIIIPGNLIDGNLLHKYEFLQLTLSGFSDVCFHRDALRYFTLAYFFPHWSEKTREKLQSDLCKYNCDKYFDGISTFSELQAVLVRLKSYYNSDRYESPLFWYYFLLSKKDIRFEWSANMKYDSVKIKNDKSIIYDSATKSFKIIWGENITFVIPEMDGMKVLLLLMKSQGEKLLAHEIFSLYTKKQESSANNNDNEALKRIRRVVTENLVNAVKKIEPEWEKETSFFAFIKNCFCNKKGFGVHYVYCPANIELPLVKVPVEYFEPKKLTK